MHRTASFLFDCSVTFCRIMCHDLLSLLLMGVSGDSCLFQVFIGKGGQAPAPVLQEREECRDGDDRWPFLAGQLVLRARHGPEWPSCLPAGTEAGQRVLRAPWVRISPHCREAKNNLLCRHLGRHNKVGGSLRR